MNEIFIENCLIDLNQFLRYNNESSTNLTIILKFESENVNYNLKVIKQLILVLELLDRYRYPIDFLLFNQIFF